MKTRPRYLQNVKPAKFSAFTLVLKMFLLIRKDQFGGKLEKEVAIFLLFALMFLRFKKAISYHLEGGDLMTMIDQQSILSQIFLECWREDTFKQRFLNDPKSVLTEYGISTTDDIDIEVVENTDRKVHVVLPATLIDEETAADADLRNAPCQWGMCRPKGSTGN